MGLRERLRSTPPRADRRYTKYEPSGASAAQVEQRGPGLRRLAVATSFRSAHFELYALDLRAIGAQSAGELRRERENGVEILVAFRALRSALAVAESHFGAHAIDREVLHQLHGVLSKRNDEQDGSAHAGCANRAVQSRDDVRVGLRMLQETNAIRDAEVAPTDDLAQSSATVLESSPAGAGEANSSRSADR